MEAKDTVMQFEPLYEYYKKVRETNVGLLSLTADGYAFIKFNEALEAQAEISFKEGRESMIKEVVKEFETVLDAPESYRLSMFFDVLSGWQAFLKEKGIK